MDGESLMGYDTSADGLPLRNRAGERFAYHDAARQLADAMAELPGFVTPSTARALQATENLWRTIELDHGLLTSRAVADLLGRPGNLRLVSRLRVTGQLIGVERRKRILYPGFQFDSVRHQVRSVIQPLIQIAYANNFSDEDLTEWVYTTTSYFEDDRRPVDHLEPPEKLLQVASDAMGIEW